ncbi:hypothetical protein [Polluticaenibacter yanchengensis]|uniref:Uncharacterized protein n=1 Tax=Polluticaenibacter yanchengensis TaxID=3014562 RepID=A0ABT4UID0_9BACT|nr:hypothetical protein [Chitinophagaceae bacterium LY-5]
MNKKPPSLIFCILMDLAGYLTFAVPGIGEFGDIFWAPVSAIIFYKTFGGTKGFFGSIFNFIEEALPFTDFVPSFSLMWLWMYKSENSIESRAINKQ